MMNEAEDLELAEDGIEPLVVTQIILMNMVIFTSIPMMILISYFIVPTYILQNIEYLRRIQTSCCALAEQFFLYPSPNLRIPLNLP
jgi:hypothetical protein